jgi:beta-galactosidase GanA
MTSKEIERLYKSTWKSVLEKMPDEQRNTLLEYVDILVVKLKSFPAHVMFSQNAAMELLFKLGLYEKLQTLPGEERRKLQNELLERNNNGKISIFHN